VALDGDGNIYVADRSNHTIRKITPDGIVSTLAGSPGLKGSDDGMGDTARFRAPSGVTVDSQLFAFNSKGTATIPLLFFEAPPSALIFPAVVRSG
jgi:hypothetical protein